MTTNRGILLLTLIALVLPQKALSWGRTGHEAVALIANENLNQKAKTQIKKLLGATTIDQAAIWADQVKRAPIWEHTRTYHYSDISDGLTYWNALKAMPKEELAQGDLLRSLVKAENILRDPSASMEQKKWSLFFMVHFMGDLHQPLHAGRPGDRGGNDIIVNYFGKKTNLHAVWDTYIISEILNPPQLETAPDPVLEYLKHLRTPSKKEVKKWQTGYVLDWLEDTMSYRDEVYADAKISNNVYQKKYASLVDDQILKGGYRLAAWLNAIFSSKEFAGPSAKDVREKIAGIVKNATDTDIILEPNSNKQISDHSEDGDFCGHIEEL